MSGKFYNEHHVALEDAAQKDYNTFPYDEKPTTEGNVGEEL